MNLSSHPTELALPDRVIGISSVGVERFESESGLKWIVKPDSVVTHNGVTAIIHLAP